MFKWDQSDTVNLVGVITMACYFKLHAMKNSEKINYDVTGQIIWFRLGNIISSKYD